VKAHPSDASAPMPTLTLPLLYTKVLGSTEQE
jgi:hypothetical protein